MRTIRSSTANVNHQGSLRVRERLVIRLGIRCSFLLVLEKTIFVLLFDFVESARGALGGGGYGNRLLLDQSLRWLSQWPKGSGAHQLTWQKGQRVRNSASEGQG
jgi:hypothetical protein